MVRKLGGELLQAFSQYKLLRKSHCNMHILCSEFVPKNGPKVGGGNFYRLFHSINCLENPIVICIKKVVNLLQKKWSESRGGGKRLQVKKKSSLVLSHIYFLVRFLSFCVL